MLSAPAEFAAFLVGDALSSVHEGDMEVFLSYPSEKEGEARLVYSFLNGLGINLWFDKESLIPGQDWDRERLDAQTRTDLTVLICSKETIERDGVIQREVRAMLDRMKDKPLGSIFCVPIRTQNVQLPPELAKYQYTDMFARNWQVALARSMELRINQLKEEIPRS